MWYFHLFCGLWKVEFGITGRKKLEDLAKDFKIYTSTIVKRRIVKEFVFNVVCRYNICHSRELLTRANAMCKY